MFLESGAMLAMLPSRKGDWAGWVCGLPTAGVAGNVRVAREWQSHTKPSAAEIWSSLEFCTSPWKEREVWTQGPPVGEGDSDIALLSGLREKKVMQRWFSRPALGEQCWSLTSNTGWLSSVGLGSDCLVPLASPGSQGSASVGKPRHQVDWASGCRVSSSIVCVGCVFLVFSNNTYNCSYRELAVCHSLTGIGGRHFYDLYFPMRGQRG